MNNPFLPLSELSTTYSFRLASLLTFLAGVWEILPPELQAEIMLPVTANQVYMVSMILVLAARAWNQNPSLGK